MKITKFNKTLLITLIVTISAILSLWTINITSEIYQKPYTEKIFYYRLDNTVSLRKPSYEIFEIMKDVASYCGIKLEKASHFSNSNFVTFLSLDHIDNLIVRVNYPMKCSHIYGICGTDLFVSKSALYENMSSYLPIEVVNKILPKTYCVYNKTHMHKLRKRTENSEIVYIAKKNIQRQEGFKIFTNPNEKIENDYVVVQEMLQNPYIIDGRKINVRVYLLIVIKDNKINFYVYKNGFVYYTVKAFEKYSTDFKKIITTGYIDRSVYENNPLTLENLKEYMGENDYNKFMKNMLYIVECFKNVYTPILLEKNRSIRCTKFLIYGMDIAPSECLGAKLIEINKGPDLTYKDKRDKEVKFNLVKNTLEVVGLIKDSGEMKNYIKI